MTIFHVLRDIYEGVHTDFEEGKAYIDDTQLREKKR